MRLRKRQQKTNFTIKRGDDTALRFTFKIKGKTGELMPLDLNRYRVFDLQAKSDCSDEIVLSLSSDENIQVINAEQGEIVLIFNHEMTEQAKWDIADFDLQAQDEQGRVKTLASGRIRLDWDVTRGKRE